MKLGFDAKRVYSNRTGLGNYSRTILTNLIRYYPENEYFFYTTKKNSKTGRFKLPDTPPKKISITTGGGALWRSFGIAKQINKDKIQLYHGLSNELPILSNKNPVKKIVTIHDLIFRIYPETYHFSERFVYDCKAKYSCNHADKILAISENTKRDIIKYYGVSSDKIDVIYQACSPIFYEHKDFQFCNKIIEKYKLPKNYLLYVGSVTKRKNLMTVLKAFELLPHDHKIPLLIVGSGKAYKSEVQAFSEKAKLNKYLIWLDELADNNDLQAIYQAAKIFIYPSIYEGFGIPIIEALLSKVPVITSKVSSLPEASGPNSLCIDPFNFEEMAAGIEKILTDNKLATKMSEEGYRFALEKFSPEKLTHQLFQLYKSVLYY